MKSKAALVLVSALALGSSIAAAQGPARALLDEGLDLREAGRDAEALERFERAFRADPSAEALAQIGLAEQAIGRWAPAEEHVSAALARGGPWIDARREPLQSALTIIRRQLGSLEVTGGLEGARVRVNGEEVAVFPLRGPLRIEVGAATIEVVASGYMPFRRSVDVSTDALARLNVALVAGSSERATAAPTSGGANDLFLILGASALAAAVVGGAMSLGFYFERERNAEHWNDDELCTPIDGGSRSQNCNGHRSAAADNETAAVASMAIGGAFLAGGTSFLLVGLLGGSPASESTAFACGAGPGELGISCRGAF